MNNKVPSNKTFSIASQFQSNFQVNKCEFCMYRGVIFEQLNRLKQAILIKNQRIIQLQQFIKKISKMAFINNNNSKHNNYNEKISHDQQINSSRFKNQLKTMQIIQYQQSNSKKNNYNNMNNQLKFQDSDQISFRLSKKNGQGRDSQMVQDSLIRDKFIKLNELNQMKKQIQKKIKNSPSKNKLHVTSKDEKQKQSSRFKEYSTIRTLSEPHEEGVIGLIHNIQDNDLSQIEQISQKSAWYDKFKRNFEVDQASFTQSLNGNSAQNNREEKDRIPVDIIRQFIRQKIK